MQCILKDMIICSLKCKHSWPANQLAAATAAIKGKQVSLFWRKWVQYFFHTLKDWNAVDIFRVKRSQPATF